MADQRTTAVANPFTRNPSRMKRNTRGSKWVSEGAPYKQNRRGPERPVELFRGNAYRGSQAASVSEVSASRASWRESAESVYSLSKPAVYDIREIPDANLRFSGFDWDDDDEAVSPRTKVRSGDQAPLFHIPTPPEVSPLSANFTTRRDSPVSDLDAMRWSHMKDPEERKESDATVFPRFSYTLPKLPPKPNKKEKGKKEKQVRFPEASSSGHEERTDTHEASAGKSGSRLADLFRSAREIYSAGPRGEGQKIWSGIRKKKRAQKQAAKQHQLQIIRENPQPQAYGSPTPFTPARPSPPPPLGVSRGRSSPRPKHAHVPLTPHSLAGAGYYSQSGYSIPVAASASVQYDGQEVVVDGYKPLPPVPKLDAAPKNRDEVRERKTPSPPPPPPPRPVPSKNPERVIRQQVGTTSSTTAPQPQSRTQWFSELDDQQTERPRRTPQRKEPGRLRRFFSLFLNIEEPSDPHAGAATNHHPAKKHSKLKAQISHPGPMAVLDNRTVNVAVENGGVGGPAAAISLPLRNGEIVQPRRHAAQGKKGKGKQKRLTPPPPVAQSESPASDSKILDSSSSKAKDHGASKEKPSHCWRDMLLTSPSRPYSDSKVPSGSKPQSKPHAGLKEKPSHRWRDMLTSPGEHGGKSFYSGLRETERGWGRRRKSSDVSFACQGIISSALCADYPSHPDYPVMNPYASAAQYHGQQQARGGGIARANAIRDPGPSSQTQTQIHNQRYEFEDRDAVVAPLFCGIGGTMASNGGGDRIRDTRFYQAYDDVLGEYEKN